MADKEWMAVAGKFDTCTMVTPLVAMKPSPSSSGPLQGSARVVKDHCADWYNYIEKWNALNDKGLAVVNGIVTAKLQLQYSKSSETASMGDGDLNAANSQGLTESQMPHGLEDLCAELTAVYKSLEKLLNKMATITKHLQGVCDMERSQSGSVDSRPLFQTWPAEQFVECSARLQDMYTKELGLKRALTEDVAHASNRDVLMTYTSAWLHQPYVDDEATVLVESMLRETGHR